MDRTQPPVIQRILKERVYVDDVAEVPEGKEPEQGPRGGIYYEGEGEDPTGDGLASRVVDSIVSLFSPDSDTGIDDVDGFPDAIHIESPPTRADIMGNLGGDDDGPISPASDITAPSPADILSDPLADQQPATAKQDTLSTIDQIMDGVRGYLETHADAEQPVITQAVFALRRHIIRKQL